MLYDTSSLIFLSTLSLRRATEQKCCNRKTNVNFYPRSPCGERLEKIKCCCNTRDFYPRSPCGERPYSTRANVGGAGISIHALLAESDEYWVGGYGTANNFYPRSPCGERLPWTTSKKGDHHISIHALLAESDWRIPQNQLSADGISIHALLAESDIQPGCRQPGKKYFYPRSPCGERRPNVGCQTVAVMVFLSTLSLRRATA